MNNNTPWALVIILIIAMIGCIYGGYCMGEKKTYKEAVDKGFGYYSVNKYGGNTQFYWNTNLSQIK